MSKAIGIDLGTTYSCVAVYRNGKVEIIPNETGAFTTPSVVSFEGKERLIGEAAKENITKNYKNTVYDAKRLIGRRFDDKTVQDDMKRWPFKVVKDENSDRPIIVVDYMNEKKKFFAEEISAMILQKLKQIADDYLKYNVENAIITVPAYFNDSQRQATKDAGRIAGLNVLRIINEPTAAAVAYGLDHKNDKEKNILVFDLGGGTFDVSILNVCEETLEVKSTSGNTHLGGEDFDNKIMEYCIEEFKSETGVDISRNQKAIRRLKKHCEDAKKILSSARETTIDIESISEDEDMNIVITRTTFEERCKELFEKCFDSIKEALKDAGLTKNDIDDIVLVGGSSRIPKIQEMIKQYFNGKELCKDINADEAVAYGAAYQAASIGEEEEDDALEKLVLVDVTPLSLGLEIKGGIMSKIIKKNTPIPISKNKIYQTASDNQEEAKFTIYQGERKLVKDNVKIGEYTVKIKGRGKAGEVKFKVDFSIDVNSVLHVNAKEINKDNEIKLDINAETMKMSDEEIEKKIEEAKKYKMQDKKIVEAIKAKIHLQDMCLQLKGKCSAQKNKVIDEILNWIKVNQKTAEKEDYENQEKKLNNIK